MRTIEMMRVHEPAAARARAAPLPQQHSRHSTQPRPCARLRNTAGSFLLVSCTAVARQRYGPKCCRWIRASEQQPRLGTRAGGTGHDAHSARSRLAAPIAAVRPCRSRLGIPISAMPTHARMQSPCQSLPARPHAKHRDKGDMHNDTRHETRPQSRNSRRPMNIP